MEEEKENSTHQTFYTVYRIFTYVDRTRPVLLGKQINTLVIDLKLLQINPAMLKPLF